MKIAIFGANGFVGRALSQHFQSKNHNCFSFVRTPKEGEYGWDPTTGRLDHLEPFDVVINLAGESIVGRWSTAKKERLYDSRVQSTRFLVDKLENCLPRLYIGASAVGFYGDRQETLLTEDSEGANDFLSSLCQDWEKASAGLPTRVVHARFGLLLSPNGGVLAKMLPAFRLGLGGPLGSGVQYMSWMALEDVIGAMEHIIHHEELRGPINFTTPQPLTNNEFSKLLGQKLKRPSLCRVPHFVLRLLFGEGAQVFTMSTRALPQKLEDSGYPFIYDDFSKYPLH